MRLARPLILTIAAGLAFAVLLRFHHAKFEDGMVRTFQKQQLDTTRSWSDSVEKQVAGIRRDLASLASQPEVCRFAPGMKDTLSSCLARENSILDDIEVFDAGGARLWSGRAVQRGETQDEPGPSKAGNRLCLRLPIERDGKQVGTLQASVNVFGVAFGCQPKGDSAYKSLWFLLSSSGEVIHGGDTISKSRRVVHALQDADAPKEAVGNVELLPYVVDRCIKGGSSGLAQTVRQEGNVEELVAFASIDLEGHRFGLVMGSPRADVSVPIVSHERVTYTLIVALALLYFATGYTAFRSERAHSQLEKQRRRAAEEASKAKGSFLAKMSHELRTPMNGIISMTELATDAENAADRQKYLGVVRECADSLLSVVNDILDMSKIEAGKLELSRVPFNVQTCVAHTLEALAPLAKDKGLSLRWEMDGGIPTMVSGDPGRLRQVLNNLIGNAIKFTDSGEVVVRVAPQAMRSDLAVLRFDVNDTGLGMSADDVKRLFNPYYQCSNAEAYRKSGTGLGLAIAKQLVELMGGRISVASEVGQGTVFTFTAEFGHAPCDALDAGEKTMPSAANIRAHAGGLRILLVEDNPVNQQAAVLLLSQWGHNVHAVGSGEEAVSILLEREFDLVLMDLELPGIDGIEATAGIRQRENSSGRRTPIIAMTAHAMDSDRERCLAAGMDGYVSKPFRPDQLRRVVEDVSVGAIGGDVEPSRQVGESTSAPTEPVWDLSEALRLADGDRNAVGLIVTTFLNDLRETLPAAHDAALARDEKRLAAMAHRWRGSLGLLGARRAFSCAVSLEELCRLGEPERLLESFQRLHSELLVLEKALSITEQETALCRS